MGLVLSKRDLSGQDFREASLVGYSFAHSTLDGVNFERADLHDSSFACAKGSAHFARANITGCSFERAEEQLLQSLVGSVWNGITLSAVSGWITRDEPDQETPQLYWCFASNAFVQIGCMTRTLAEWEAIGQNLDTLRVLHEEQPKIDLPATLTWWRANREAIVRTVQSFGK